MPETSESTETAGQSADATQAGDPPKPAVPPWGDAENFDAEKAWSLIQNLRAEKGVDWQSEKKELEGRLKAFEDRDKSETEKLAERAAAAEKAAGDARQEALRFRIAAKHNISDEDAESFLTGSDEESMTKQAKRLVELRGEQKRFTGSADGGARKPPPTTVSPNDLIRAALKR